MNQHLRNLIFSAFIIMAFTGCSSSSETPSEEPATEVTDMPSEETPAATTPSELSSETPTTAESSEPQVDYGSDPVQQDPPPPTQAAAKPAPPAHDPMPMEAPQKSAPAKSGKVRKSGFYVFAKACVMRNKPSAKGTSAGNIAKGKRLWLDKHDASWMKAHKKSGSVFVSTSCLK